MPPQYDQKRLDLLIDKQKLDKNFLDKIIAQKTIKFKSKIKLM
ncbi:hypothetical protein NPA08_04155 [Mycoplasmopsis citelli]|nr:hypothetical protein [Mycoplasmopsis citelli]UUD36114.1 hypothetical protein NPA08_04155 [Mycoplasmopsis citelli]